MPNPRQSSRQCNIFIQSAPLKRALNPDNEPQPFLRGDGHESSLHSPRGIRLAASLNAASGVTFGASRLPLQTVGDKQGRASHAGSRLTQKQGSAPEAYSTHTRPAKPGGHHDTTSHITSGIADLRPNSALPSQTPGTPEDRGVPQHPDTIHTSKLRAERPRRGVRQDKARFSNARTSVRQPALETHVSRAPLTNNKVVRSQSVAPASQRLVQVTLWVDPAVKEHLERRAKQEGLSLSPAGAAFLRKAVQQDTDLNYSALLRPVIEDAIARKMAGIVTRLTWLLVRIAFDAGQTRSIVTNILGKQQGMTQPLLKTILEESGRSAKANIMRRTPQIQTLISSVEHWMNEADNEQDGKPTH